MQKVGDTGSAKIVQRSDLAISGHGQGTNQSGNAGQDGGIPQKKTKNVKNLLKRDANGEIIYPITVNNSLKIENLGKIDFIRPNYHTEKNLFPIGFKSIRE